MLYLFTADSVQGQSACDDACAVTWPPVTTSAAPTAGEDAAGGELSTITCTDGSTQVVYGEYPLYYFAGDTGPGQANGQGSGGQWWIVGLKGEPVRTVTGSPAVTSGTTTDQPWRTGGVMRSWDAAGRPRHRRDRHSCC